MLARVTRFLFGRDFFVSYTRRDAAPYASSLVKALSATHSCYLDQLATPRGPQLPAPIRKELFRASMLVLVGSPAVLESLYVGEEARGFLETGRPILIVDVDDALVGAPWATAPWSSLVGVYRQHETTEALRSGEPSSTVLTYLRGSFAFMKHDRRLLTATTAAATLLAMAIGGGALISGIATQRAAAATERAGEQERIASSRRLANESGGQDTDPELAMLLAAHAFRTAPTLEARRALLAALSRYPGLSRIVPASIEPVATPFAVSVDGRVVASSDGHVVDVWDATTLEHRVRIGTPETEVKALAMSPDGTLLAMARESDVALVDVTKGQEVGHLPDVSAATLVFTGPGQLAVAALGHVDLWDVTQPAHPMSQGVAMPTSSVLTLAADPAGRVLAAASLTELVTCRLPMCAATAKPLPGGELAYLGLAFAPASDIPMLAGVNLGGRLGIWELESGRRIINASLTRDLNLKSARAGFSQDMYSVALGPGGASIVVGSLEGRLMFATFDALAEWFQDIPEESIDRRARDANEVLMAGALAAGPDVRRVPYGPGVARVGLAANGNMIVAQTGGGLSLWDPASNAPFVFSREWPENRGAKSTHAVSADGRHIAFVEFPPVVRLWDAEHDGSPVPMTFADPFTPMAMAVNADGMLVAAVNSGGDGGDYRTLIVWDAMGRVVLQTPVDTSVWPSVEKSTYPTQLAFGGPGGRLLGLALGDGTLAVWDIAAPGPRLLGARAGVHVMAISPLRAEVAIAKRSGEVARWDVTSGALTSLPGSGAEFISLTYDADGLALTALGSPAPGVTMTTWDLRSPGEPRTWTLLEQSATAKTAAVSHDHASLAIANGTRVDVWDMRAQALVYSHALKEEPEAVSFDARGGVLTTFWREVVYLDLDPERMIDYLCGITSRRLTDAEAQRYLGGPAVSPCRAVGVPATSK